jgi:hypothetical protein
MTYIVTLSLVGQTLIMRIPEVLMICRKFLMVKAQRLVMTQTLALINIEFY